MTKHLASLLEERLPCASVRLLGRLDETQTPPCFDWTGSGFETRLQGSALWVELEATVSSPDMWVLAAVDGLPVTRFPVLEGRRWYPLVLGMDKAQTRRITLMKETQAMPHAPKATVKAHALRHDGALSLPPEPALRIEFVGDSLTSAEGTLAPKGNNEWISMWFSACANYTHVCCAELGAERRVLSQSGRGVVWDFTGSRAGNMADSYEQICGVLTGEEAEARGCQKPYDFSAWPADFVCVRLLSNDVGGLRRLGDSEAKRAELVEGAVAFAKTVRRNNPTARIVWILPSSKTLPELGERVVEESRRQGVDRITAFRLPDYGESDLGARNHPNAAYNERAGHLLADYLKTIV